MNQNIFWMRSFCPKCRKTLLGRDLIPVFSWIALRGRCRHCSAPISFLYPLIEIAATFLLLLMCLYISPKYWPAYVLFISALLVTIRSDIETMLISRFVTLYLIPVGFILSYTKLLPIALLDSVLGALLGFGFLWGISKLFFIITKREGLGQGDVELLSFIGAFLGAIGCWISLLLGSIVGSVFGITYLLASGKPIRSKIPFGPFLAAGALVCIFLQDWFAQTLLGF